MIQQLVITMLDGKIMKISDVSLKVLLFLKREIKNKSLIINLKQGSFSESGTAVSAEYQYYDEQAL